MLTVYTLEQSEEWDKTVRSFRQYDTYWLSGYVKAFRLHGDGEPLLLYYTDNTGVRAINTVMKRDIAACPHFQDKLEPGRLFDLATPYGYGGWLIEGEDTRQLFDTYESWCRENRIVSEFVRFHPMLHNHERCTEAYVVLPLGEVVHMDLESPETIWGNLTSKNRNVIRKAVKNGVRIYNGRYPEIFETFRRIYNDTMDKDQANPYYYFKPEFYQSVLEDLQDNAQMFWAALPDGTVIAASIMLAANGRMNYHLSGSVREYSSLAATNLLLYKAALWGCSNGCRTLYMGGGVGSGEDSLFKFKRAFYRGELNRFHIGRKIFDQESYNELVDLREPINSGYFPKYRA